MWNAAAKIILFLPFPLKYISGIPLPIETTAKKPTDQQQVLIAHGQVELDVFISPV